MRNFNAANGDKEEFNRKFKELIDNECKLYWFDQVIEIVRSRNRTLHYNNYNNLESVLKFDEKNVELKKFIEYLKKINNDELKVYFKYNNIAYIFRYEENKEIEYFKNNIINTDENYDEFLENVKGYAYILKKNGLTTSQIRNIYSDILRTDSNSDLKKLRPKFAYIAGRSKENSVKKFMDLLDYVVKSMDNGNENNDQLNSFKSFLEAIVAYMKYFGDKN